jgi:DNA-binding MarR family transcriptional regulator
MKKNVVEGLVKELYGLGTVRRELARHALAELGSQGFNALAAVHVHGPIRVSDVATRLSVDLSVASRQLTALVKAGYVTSETDGDDGRAMLLTTTDAGRHALKESHRRMVHVFQGALADWTETDVTALSDALARLRADFESASTPARPAER